MLTIGIQPKPQEFQRIVLIKAGEPDLANFLDDNHIIFDRNVDVDPIELKGGKFNDLIEKVLSRYLKERSSLPFFISKRINGMTKESSDIASMGERSIPGLGLKEALVGLAGLYAGLKMKSKRMSPKDMIDTASSKPWLVSLIGGGVVYKLLGDKNNDMRSILKPAYEYEDSLQNTYFGGHTKISSIGGSAALGVLTGAALYPSSHIINAYNQRSLYNKGKELFPGAGSSPKNMAIKGGLAMGGTHYLGPKAYGGIKRSIGKLFKLK
jgi:hypothetical protein